MHPEHRAASRPVVGRETELGEIGRVLSAVREGLSGVLVLRGEAGIGKTALLDHAVASAGDLRALRLVGIKSEMSLGFAGLHQLLSPLADGFDELPPPQRDALRSAFGLSAGAEPDRFLIGLGTLTLLAATASEHGLLIAVDDAQWLDRESSDAIAFVSRRLVAEGVGIVWGVRDPSESDLTLEGLPTLMLDGLTESEAGELLIESAGAPIEARVRSRLLANARGNPLALVELSRELSREQLAGLEFLPEPFPVSAQLEARFLRQVQSLPAETQRLLLVASADPTGDPALVWRAGVDLGFGAAAIVPAEHAGLVALGPTISFRHPLIREAIYSGSVDEERRRAHSALAAATDAQSDPDRRAWHRASACVAADADVADELELAADRARRHGSYAATAAFLARSAELTPQRPRRAARFLGAAAADLTAGNPSRARTHLELAAPDVDDAFLRASARRVEGMISWMDPIELAGSTGPPEVGSVDAPRLLVEAGAALCEFDAHAARETFFDAINASTSFGEWSIVDVSEVAVTARRALEARGAGNASKARVHDALMDLFCDGHGAAEPSLRRALVAAHGEAGLRSDLQSATMLCWLAFALGDYDRLSEVVTELITVCREQGALFCLSAAYLFLGTYELAVGSLRGAEAGFANEGDVHTLRGMDERLLPIVSGSHLLILAWNGSETELREAVSEFAAEAPRRGLGWSLNRVRWALALLELGLGNYTAAASAIPREGWQFDLAVSAFIASDVIEANVRAGYTGTAQDALDWLARRAEANQTPLELGLLHRSRALLSEASDAEDEFTKGIELLEGNAGVHHLGRAHLLYGEWLRRQRRQMDARRELGVALDMFSAVGAAAFAERARLELLATGAKARKRVAETRMDLSPQEDRVARLAAGGATNAEIASALFVSRYTVDYHLRNVFTKLGLTSRRQLADALS